MIQSLSCVRRFGHRQPSSTLFSRKISLLPSCFHPSSTLAELLPRIPVDSFWAEASTSATLPPEAPYTVTGVSGQTRCRPPLLPSSPVCHHLLEKVHEADYLACLSINLWACSNSQLASAGVKGCIHC